VVAQAGVELAARLLPPESNQFSACGLWKPKQNERKEQ
jgi:hypothetical protein